MVKVKTVAEFPLRHSQKYRSYIILRIKEYQAKKFSYTIVGLLKTAPKNIYEKDVDSRKMSNYSDTIFRAPKGGDMLTYSSDNYPKKLIRKLLISQGEMIL